MVWWRVDKEHVTRYFSEVNAWGNYRLVPSTCVFRDTPLGAQPLTIATLHQENNYRTQSLQA